MLCGLAAALAAACGDLRGGGDIVYDTIGGIPAVLNPDRGLSGETLGWTFEEHLRVSQTQAYDDVSGSFALDAGILPGGAVAVLDAAHQRVLRFGPDGSYERSFGGEGEGEGRFRNAFMLEVADTLIYVLDIGRNGVTAFNAEGEPVSSFEIDLSGLAGTTPMFEVGAPGEIYLAAEPVPFRMQQVRDTGNAVIYRIDDEGAIADTVLAYSASSWTPLSLPEGRTTFAKPRFWPEPRLDARGSLVALSHMSPYIIDVRRPDGAPVRRIARQYENTVVDAAVRDSVLGRMAASSSQLSREVLEDVPFEPEIPAIEGLALDDAGRIWVDPYQPEAPARRDIFDSEGRYLGAVDLPEPMQLTDIRGDLACGVISDPENRAAEAVCYRVTIPVDEIAAE